LRRKAGVTVHATHAARCRNGPRQQPFKEQACVRNVTHQGGMARFFLPADCADYAEERRKTQRNSWRGEEHFLSQAGTIQLVWGVRAGRAPNIKRIVPAGGEDSPAYFAARNMRVKACPAITRTADLPSIARRRGMRVSQILASHFGLGSPRSRQPIICSLRLA